MNTKTKTKASRDENHQRIAPEPHVVVTTARHSPMIGFSCAPNRQSPAYETQGHVLQRGVKLNYKRLEIDAAKRLAICTDLYGYVSVFRLAEIRFRIIG